MFAKLGSNIATKAFGKSPSIVNDVVMMSGFHYLENRNIGESIAKGSVDAVLWGSFGAPMLAYQIGQGAIAAAEGWENYSRTQKTTGYKTGTINGARGFTAGTQQAMTMRQAAVQELQRSRINGRMSLGNEASFLHK